MKKETLLYALIAFVSFTGFILFWADHTSYAIDNSIELVVLTMVLAVLVSVMPKVNNGGD